MLFSIRKLLVLFMALMLNACSAHPIVSEVEKITPAEALLLRTMKDYATYNGPLQGLALELTARRIQVVLKVYWKSGKVDKNFEELVVGFDHMIEEKRHLSLYGYFNSIADMPNALRERRLACEHALRSPYTSDENREICAEVVLNYRA